MAARGAEAKEVIIDRLIKEFGAFQNGKEIRIPMTENGNLVQIKVALTCAKDNIEVGTGADDGAAAPASMPSIEPPTREEKNALEELIAGMGM